MVTVSIHLRRLSLALPATVYSSVWPLSSPLHPAAMRPPGLGLASPSLPARKSRGSCVMKLPDRPFPSEPYGADAGPRDFDALAVRASIRGRRWWCGRRSCAASHAIRHQQHRLPPDPDVDAYVAVTSGACRGAAHRKRAGERLTEALGRSCRASRRCGFAGCSGALALITSATAEDESSLLAPGGSRRPASPSVAAVLTVLEWGWAWAAPCAHRQTTRMVVTEVLSVARFRAGGGIDSNTGALGVSRRGTVC